MLNGPAGTEGHTGQEGRLPWGMPWNMALGQARALITSQCTLLHKGTVESLGDRGDIYCYLIVHLR